MNGALSDSHTENVGERISVRKYDNLLNKNLLIIYSSRILLINSYVLPNSQRIFPNFTCACACFAFIDSITLPVAAGWLFTAAST